MTCRGNKTKHLVQDDRQHYSLASSSSPFDTTASRQNACRLLLRQRQATGRALGFDMCPDPAWDMLLELYGAQHEGRKITLTNLCSASNVPFTTARRALDELVARQLAARERDPDDGRRIFVVLTEIAEHALDAILDEFLHDIAD